MARCFAAFCDVFSHHFIVRGKDIGQHARTYLSGLLGTVRRKNIGRIEQDVAASNYQGMQQLVSDSPWDHEALLGAIAQGDRRLLGGHRDTALYLDESSFVKNGEASVGVQRQYCGRLGKIENCQVGVFACPGRAGRALRVDFRLFLSEAWAKNASRGAKAKIPQEQQVHRTKAELGLALVETAFDHDFRRSLPMQTEHTARSTRVPSAQQAAPRGMLTMRCSEPPRASRMLRPAETTAQHPSLAVPPRRSRSHALVFRPATPLDIASLFVSPDCHAGSGFHV